MPVYTVREATLREIKPWNDKQVPIRDLVLANGSGQEKAVELFDIANTDPKVGQQVEGEVSQDDRGRWKFKPAKTGGKGGGRKSKEELAQDLLISRETRSSIEAQTSVKAATEFLHDKQGATVEMLAETAKTLFAAMQEMQR